MNIRLNSLRPFPYVQNLTFRKLFLLNHLPLSLTFVALMMTLSEFISLRFKHFCNWSFFFIVGNWLFWLVKISFLSCGNWAWARKRNRWLKVAYKLDKYIVHLVTSSLLKQLQSEVLHHLRSHHTFPHLDRLNQQEWTGAAYYHPLILTSFFFLLQRLSFWRIGFVFEWQAW